MTHIEKTSVKKNLFKGEGRKVFFVVLGGIIAAVGLEAFLIPNGFLDGGVVGISILLAAVLKNTFDFTIPMGVFIGVLNIPFIIMGWKMLGRRSALRTAIGVATLSVGTIVLHHMTPWSTNFFVALVAGGAMLGYGVALAIKYGGALDGTELLAVIAAKHTKYGVNQIILAINCVIFAVAIPIVGLSNALASIILFAVTVSRVIEKFASGTFDKELAVVATVKPVEVATVITENIEHRVKFTEKKVFNRDTLSFDEVIWELDFVITDLEKALMEEEIRKVDPDARIRFSPINSLHGSVYDTEDDHH